MEKYTESDEVTINTAGTEHTGAARKNNDVLTQDKNVPSREARTVKFIVGILAVAFLACGCFYFLPPFWKVYKSSYIEVKADMTGAEIADELYAEELVSNPLLFRAVLALTGQAGELKRGEYTIHSTMSLHQIVAKLTSGDSEAYRLVVPEGYTVRQIAKAVAENTNISEEEFLVAANKAELLYPYMKGNRQVTFVTEGFLFPDTYYPHFDGTADDLVVMMLKNFDDRLDTVMRNRIGAGNFSVYQAVTLASVVEKEAKYDRDRPLIASVFLNRLKRHMKLQSDASVSYAMGSHKYEYNLDEIAYDSPYNTYLHEGLPPGPIGNPGMKSIYAVLDAPETSYLYFVADKEGHNYFAVTYEEHMDNVHKYMP